MTAQIDTSTPEFQNALSLVRFTRQSVFLTGRAGTGKSTFLRYVCEHVRKKHVVLAPTGIAAINAGGCTLHSFFKLPFHPLLPDDPRYAPSRLKDFLKYTRDRIRLIRNVELIIIDEISMVRADIIDFIDRHPFLGLAFSFHRIRGLYFAGRLLAKDRFQMHIILNLIPLHDKTCTMRTEDRRSRILHISCKIISTRGNDLLCVMTGIIPAKFHEQMS